MSQERENSFPAEQKKELSVKRRRKVVISLLILSLICGFAYLLWQFLQRPVIGVIRVGTLPVKDESFEQGKELKHFAGKYISFSYPGMYAEKTHELPETGPKKESVFLSAADFEGRKLAIAVEEWKSGGLEASPSFQMRLNNPKVYEHSSLRWNEFDGVVFTKNSQVFEKTVFFWKSSSILSISVTSPFSIDTLQGDLENILKNLEWKTRE